jgi:hypothetical protein
MYYHMLLKLPEWPIPPLGKVFRQSRWAAPGVLVNTTVQSVFGNTLDKPAPRMPLPA